MSRPLKLKVHGAVRYRLSNSPTWGPRAVCGGAPQTFHLDTPDKERDCVTRCEELVAKVVADLLK